MTPDPFETRLATTPVRALPPAWRARILATARECHAYRWAILWPHPFAWGALAACWFVIAALNISGPRGKELYVFAPAGIEPVVITTEHYFAYLKTRDAILGERPELILLDRRNL